MALRRRRLQARHALHCSSVEDASSCTISGIVDVAALLPASSCFRWSCGTRGRGGRGGGADTDLYDTDREMTRDDGTFPSSFLRIGVRCFQSNEVLLEEVLSYSQSHPLCLELVPAKEDSPEFLHLMFRLYCPLQHFSLCSIVRICNKFASLLWKTCVVDRKEHTLPAWNHRRVSESANTTIYPQATESASKTSRFETEGFLSVSFMESGRTFFYICRFFFVNLQKVSFVPGVWKDILHVLIFFVNLLSDRLWYCDTTVRNSRITTGKKAYVFWRRLFWIHT